MNTWNDDSLITALANKHPVLSYLTVLVALPVCIVVGLTLSTSLIAAPFSLLLGWL